MDPAEVVPHIMRHTAITRLAASGADIKTIQEFSGHESLAMVLRYAHAQDHVIDSALDRLEGGTLLELPSAKTERKS
jgi:integrase